MTQALGRVLQQDDLEGPRGPDGRLRITVPREWLVEARWIELDLPRMLECARCRGGGCDGCERSGAVVTRGRKELAEVVELKLPESAQAVTLRLPRRGGLPPDATPDLARGLLLLAVFPGDDASDGVRALERELPLPIAPPPTLASYALTPPRLAIAAGVFFVLLLVFVLTR